MRVTSYAPPSQVERTSIVQEGTPYIYVQHARYGIAYVVLHDFGHAMHIEAVPDTREHCVAAIRELVSAWQLRRAC